MQRDGRKDFRKVIKERIPQQDGRIQKETKDGKNEERRTEGNGGM